RFGRDDAAGTRPALDDDRLVLRAGDVVRQDANQEVDASPGRNRDDDTDRSCGLRPCGMIARSDCEAPQRQRADRTGEERTQRDLLERLRRRSLAKNWRYLNTTTDGLIEQRRSQRIASSERDPAHI